MNQKQESHIDCSGVARILNLPDALTSTEPVTLAQLNTQTYNFRTLSHTITGLTLLRIIELMLPAGTYTTRALIGTETLTDIAVLEFRTNNGDLIDLISHTGLPDTTSAGAGFILNIETSVGIYLRAGSTSARAFIFSLQLMQ